MFDANDQSPPYPTAFLPDPLPLPLHFPALPPLALSLTPCRSLMITSLHGPLCQSGGSHLDVHPSAKGHKAWLEGHEGFCQRKKNVVAIWRAASRSQAAAAPSASAPKQSRNHHSINATKEALHHLRERPEENQNRLLPLPPFHYSPSPSTSPPLANRLFVIVPVQTPVTPLSLHSTSPSISLSLSPLTPASSTPLVYILPVQRSASWSQSCFYCVSPCHPLLSLRPPALDVRIGTPRPDTELIYTLSVISWSARSPS